jgi:hypothetical protein
MSTIRMAAAVLGLIASLSAHAACTFASSNETSLQGVFDTILPSGSLSATQDCVNEGADSTWTATGQAIATIVIELAGFADQNTFGIYDAADATRRATIFAGSDAAGATATVQIMQSGSHYGVFDNGVWAADFSSSAFGFFLSTPQNNVFTSNTAFNSDGSDHMYAYRGNGGTFVGGTLAGSTFESSMYLLAFEDLAFPGSDGDYQDFVAAAQFVVPVPIPASGLLLAVVLALLVMRAAAYPARQTFV